MTVENPHNGKPRLVIQRLELENFKSYAGVQHIGPFHKSFSAIVGPNGSGKSNVIDAMLFVFGKRAKQLRLNKVSELIHKSTDFQNLDEAKVSVYFEEIIDTGEESFEAVPGSELVVSRTAQRNNASNYYLNGKKSNFTEVTNMLKAKGVDLNNNRFLILQGEVEQISLMKPKAEDKNDTGLLEYLEDIIGTDQYKEKIEETGKQLEELNEERQSFLQRAKLAERDRDGLLEAKELAEDYRRREIEELNNRSRICLHNMIQCAANGAKITQQVEELRGKLVYEQGKLSRYDGSLKEAEENLKSQEKERSKAGKALDKLTERLKAIACESVSLAEKSKHLMTKGKNAADAAAKNRKKAAEQKEAAALAREELPELEAQSNVLRSDLDTATADLQALQESMKGELNEIHKRLSTARSDLAPWNDKIQAIEATRQLAETELTLIKDRSGQAAKRLVAVQSELTAAEESVTTQQAAIASMKDEIVGHRGAQEAAQQTERSTGADVKRLEAEVAEARGAVFAMRSAAENERSRGAVSKGLMEAQDRGELAGVFGRLGDLGAIDKRYDAAVSNSSGALDNIVVDTTSTAQHCVEHLRRHNLGVATFLILDKQAHLAAEMDAAVQPPEGAARLFDLVKCRDARLRPAFFYALRNTLVANDIDQAMRIAYRSKDRRWGRVVTLKGDLIAENGTMSGGGGQVKTGKMCLGNAAPQSVDAKEARAELQRSEALLARLEGELRDATAALAEATAAAAAAEKAAKRLEMTVRKGALQAESDAKKSGELRAQLGQLQAAAQVTDEDRSRTAVLQKQVDEEGKRLARVQKDAAALAEKVASVEAELENAGGDAMKAAKDLVATIKGDIADAEKKLARHRVLLSDAQRTEKKLAAEAAKKEQEGEKAEGELADVKAKLTAMKQEEAKLAERKGELDQEVANLSDLLESAQAQFDSVRSDVGKIKAVELQIETTLADQEEILVTETAKVAEWERKVGALTSQLKKLLPAGEEVPPIDRAAVEAMTVEDRQQLEYRTTCLEAEMREMQQGVDMGAIEAFRAKDADLRKRLGELEAMTARRDGVRSAHEELRKRRLDEFMAAFLVISLKLKEMYQMITLGGDAELELVDSLDPFSEGIVFSVRPPKKSWKNISNLSGGEKTLSSLSLVFALHHFKPTPLYFMDEIDAALDFKNVSIVAHYVKERTKNAQFVVISLRNNMFELADHLVGIYKTNNCTKSVTINPNDFVVGQPDPAKTRPLLQQQRAA